MVILYHNSIIILIIVNTIYAGVWLCIKVNE